MEHRQNDQLKLATEYVRDTNCNIFLTGRAGTGKTTFLRNLRQVTPKRMVVVAPTGVATIQAGGVTIHSFFQLGFAPSLPLAVREASGEKDLEGYQKRFTRNKIRLIRSLDLLVIDEVSMVRADVMDAVDEVLRRFRNHDKPFGGVQLLMIGDLYQLSPVIREEEWAILAKHYPSIFFFDSLALRKNPPVTIELTEIFRQTEEEFIQLLNRVREKKIDSDTIAQLNTRYTPGFSPPEEEGYIHLTTHNATAMGINQARLEKLSTPVKRFTAVIEGNFPPHDFPTDEELVLKTGAQVMFIKNDPSADKAYFNGKIGTISRITEEVVYVVCPGDPSEIAAKSVTWENIRYSLNERTREVDEEVIGTFSQIPLKLAWAITIHKSQGLTFDRVLIDAEAAFASGQVYVALSRCRTFGGIVLSTPIRTAGIRVDSTVLGYSRDAGRQENGNEKLKSSKHHYQSELIRELFSFNQIEYHMANLLKTCRIHLKHDQPSPAAAIAERQRILSEELLPVSKKFDLQLSALLASPEIPAGNPLLQERIRKASVYFLEHLSGFWDFLAGIEFESDNRATQKTLEEATEKLQRALFIRLACLRVTRKGFDPLVCVRTRTDADLEFRKPAATKTTVPVTANAAIAHPELYRILSQWRKTVAAASGVPVYRILPQKALVALVNALPATSGDLKQIPGIGPARIKNYGETFLGMIRQYIAEQEAGGASSTGSAPTP